MPLILTPPFTSPQISPEDLAALPDLWMTERYKGSSFGLQVSNTVYSAQ